MFTPPHIASQLAAQRQREMLAQAHEPRLRRQLRADAARHPAADTTARPYRSRGRARRYLAVVAGLATVILLTLTGSGQASAGTGHPQTRGDLSGVYSRYYFNPYTIGGTDPYANCMHEQTYVYEGQAPVVIHDWVTAECRWPDQADGDGYYAYYNIHAGPANWFFKMNDDGNRVYYTDRLNDENGRVIWYWYAKNDLGNLWISVTPTGQAQLNPFESLYDYIKAAPIDALKAGINDRKDRNVWLYVRGLVVQDATAHPWIADSASVDQQHINDATAANVVALGQLNSTLNNIYATQHHGEEARDQSSYIADLESRGLDPDTATAIATAEAPVCDEC
jgi:hypothetical protein